MSTVQLLTADDLLRVRDGKHHELIDGKLVPNPSGWILSQVVVNILMALAPTVHGRNLGRMLGSTAGFQCFPADPNRVRRPHFAFVSYTRLPRNVRVPGHCPVAPELAVLVISESCRWNDIAVKVQDYLSANVLQVWVVDEKSRQVFVYTNDRCRLLQQIDELACEEFLPGFHCQVSALFDGIPTAE